LGNGDARLRDEDAFLFNLETKYTPKDFNRAVESINDGGFSFGNVALRLSCDPLN
jgi:hypothetical protein